MQNRNTISFQLDGVGLAQAFDSLPDELRTQGVLDLILLSLGEDLAFDPQTQRFEQMIRNGDITSGATVSEETHLSGKVIAKQEGVVAGIPMMRAIYCLVDERIEFLPQVRDGSRVLSGQTLIEISGRGQGALIGERIGLNFLGRLSGIASLTQKFVDLVEGTQAVILDTRKTAPGFRILDKYAVRMGGGQNHRMGLYDMALIKENHIVAAGGIEAAVGRVRRMFDDKYPIEVEVKDLKELQIALDLMVDRIMLDNMSLEKMQQAVAIADGRTPLEASGNVSLARLRAIAETGVDYISIGALTHSAPTFDMSMLLTQIS